MFTCKCQLICTYVDKLRQRLNKANHNLAIDLEMECLYYFSFNELNNIFNSATESDMDCLILYEWTKLRNLIDGIQ